VGPLTTEFAVCQIKEVGLGGINISAGRLRALRPDTVNDLATAMQAKMGCYSQLFYAQGHQARPAIGLKNGHDGHKQKVLCANGFYSP
jgi:hypothetical protein